MRNKRSKAGCSDVDTPRKSEAKGPKQSASKRSKEIQGEARRSREEQREEVRIKE
jgi:hypothetical protein